MLQLIRRNLGRNQVGTGNSTMCEPAVSFMESRTIRAVTVEKDRPPRPSALLYLAAKLRMQNIFTLKVLFLKCQFHYKPSFCIVEVRSGEVLRVPTTSVYIGRISVISTAVFKIFKSADASIPVTCSSDISNEHVTGSDIYRF